ncbi:MAG: cytochrome ubiquinol oxidase subunit I [Anaerolineaceae bacterium]|nr:cytochrome ubiquinol oxidase subunit I [Anaerolineaceae bacterium]
MNPITLSQSQFAFTTIYHFFFVPLTIGLSVLIAIMESMYVRTGKEVFKRMTKFWGKLFIINFAMGVVTGIVQEFEFGMNWSEYSRFVGDIFGAPLAIEALLAFFLESTFLGIWIFGWDRISKKLHLMAIWLIAFGSTMSSLWILVANSFMQNPVGYTIENGRAVMTDFFALLTNPNLFGQFTHTLLAGFATAAFFMIGISAYHLYRKNEEDMFRRSFKIAAIVGLVAVILLGGVGHMQAQEIMAINPMKMIASESMWDTAGPASMSIITIADPATKTNIFDLRIPKALSLLVNNNFSDPVMGINQLQKEYEERFGSGDYIPDVNLLNYAFRVMMGAGVLMVLLAAYSLYFIARKKPLPGIPLLKFFPAFMPLPYIACSSGWILTEMGRQPWVVFGLMKTADAVSPNLTAGTVLFSLIIFALIYAALIVAYIYLMAKYAKLAGGESQVKEAAEGANPGYGGY